MAAALPFNKIIIVMDKGFGSKKNIHALLSDKQGLRFLLAVPFTLAFAADAAANEATAIDKIENTINIGEDSMRGVTREMDWGTDHKLIVHVFYNALKAAKAKEELYSDTASMIEILRNNPADIGKNADKYKPYLNVHKAAPDSEAVSVNGYEIKVNYNAVEKKLLHSGWLVIASNCTISAAHAISIYRAKDVVEKGFYRMKDCLSLERLRVHSDDAMQSRVFICFVALIIECRIHRVMLNSGLYKQMTMKKLILTLEKLRVQHIRGKRILYPLTKEQKIIYIAFGFDFPT